MCRPHQGGNEPRLHERKHDSGGPPSGLDVRGPARDPRESRRATQSPSSPAVGSFSAAAICTALTVAASTPRGGAHASIAVWRSLPSTALRWLTAAWAGFLAIRAFASALIV